LPKVEQYAIGDQLIGSAISIPANIAEGYGRRRSAEYLRFLDIANASRCELETRLEVCVRVELISREASNDLLSQSEIVGRMLTRLRLRINQTRR
jgi:four helix bundle protein